MPFISAPLFDQADPAPFRGNTAASRAASASGAVFSLAGRRAKTARYLELLRFLGAATDQQIQEVTGWPLSSVTSIRGTLIMQARKRGLPAPIVPAGHKDVARGQRGKKTTRTLWRLA